jgi:prevent-host-death family protein
VTDTVNIHAAKTQLSLLIRRVERGEEIVIARAGRPVAPLTPLGQASRPRVPGHWPHQVVIGPDFDAPNKDIARAFER